MSWFYYLHGLHFLPDGVHGDAGSWVSDDDGFWSGLNRAESEKIVKLELESIFHFQKILKHRISEIWEKIHHLVLMWVVGGNKRHWYLINPSNESESSGDYSLGWPDQVRLWSLHLTFQDNKKLLAQSPTPPPIVKSKQIPFIASTANISHIPSFV